MSGEREQFTPSEMAAVLSHYDLGIIDSVREYPLGSRKAPKLLLLTADGRRYLLKRRAAGRDDPFKVAFAHALLGYLRQCRFPVPALVGTRHEHNSMLQLRGWTYELFEYIKGRRYDGSLEQTTHAGHTLHEFHARTQDFQTEWLPPSGSYHDADGVRHGLNAIPSTAGQHDSVIGHEAELLALTQQLHERYDWAAAQVQACGYAEWPAAIIHSDWHPGNMLFRRTQVVAILDLDAARLQPHVIDVANGMLQFSILRGRRAPGEWPDFFDETRMRRFMIGYTGQGRLSAEQRRAIPALMVESLIAETVTPIARTGSFGRLPGFGVLQMVRRKTDWLLAASGRLLGWLLE